ncbi:MAG: ethylbenzene dehydrogenase-related protein [Thermoanaerobaculales bacterium]|nr:ethylbenzene dehydrogenase-related protein [Thermoanaerobaculales bacterium]
MSTATTRPEQGSGPRPWALVAGGAAAVLLVAFALIVAERGLDRGAGRELAELVERHRLQAETDGVFFVPRVERAAVPVDPLDPAWESAPSIIVKLSRQVDAMPILERATVSSAELRALGDGEWVVWRLSWPDESPDMNVDSGRFCDAAALQFPVSGEAPHTMGDDRNPVHILHWKALWQKDVDEHFQDVQDLHPNYWADLYWFADGPAPYRVPDDFSDPRSQQWFAAFSAGNPVSDIYRTRPVEELSATGFGSLTSHRESVSDGRGVWRDGSWHLSFVRPLRTEDPLDAQFWRGGRGTVGVAVWNGGDGNVGARKHWGFWTAFELSP